MVSYYLPSTKLLVRGRKLVKMRYESYAQELEDIILYVALQDVDEGFYIDIGANDPIEISVTKFFYDRGWSGINVEPLRSKCALLENERPRDINLCIGISDRRGETALPIPKEDALWDHPDSGTTKSPSYLSDPVSHKTARSFPDG